MMGPQTERFFGTPAVTGLAMLVENGGCLVSIDCPSGRVVNPSGTKGLVRFLSHSSRVTA